MDDRQRIIKKYFFMVGIIRFLSKLFDEVFAQSVTHNLEYGNTLD
jgi:hypothetical protein